MSEDTEAVEPKLALGSLDPLALFGESLLMVVGWSFSDEVESTLESASRSGERNVEEDMVGGLGMGLAERPCGEEA